MTPDELRALADRVVLSRHFRPMAGMRDLQGRTWTANPLWRWHPHDRPDLSDPATLGCMLALVREAWECAVILTPDYELYDEEVQQGPHIIGWRAVETVRWMTVGEGATEAEALVAALEAAP